MYYIRSLQVLSFAALLALCMPTAPVSAASVEEGDLVAFVELLITAQIIPAERVDTARTLGAMAAWSQSGQTQAGLHADKVAVHASQLIEYANLDFTEGETIEGLLLIVTNTTDEEVELEATRACQVRYAVYDARDRLVYDSAREQEACLRPVRVTYFLKPHGARLLPVVHESSEKHLSRGTYRFVLTYPGYGTGERTVTVH